MRHHLQQGTNSIAVVCHILVTKGVADVSKLIAEPIIQPVATMSPPSKAQAESAGM